MNPQRHEPQRPGTDPAPKVRPDRDGQVRVEFISIGTELLKGRVRDDNAPALARILIDHGAIVSRITVLEDNAETIASTLGRALERNPHMVVTTGGLGPARDDRTILAVAAALHLPLAPNHDAKEMIEATYRELKRRKIVASSALNASREKMFMLPTGGVPIRNTVGVAPGVLCRLPGGGTVLSLPGTPEEARSVLELAISEHKLTEEKHYIARREVEAPTSDESAVRPLLDQLASEFPQIWFNSRPIDPGRPVVISLEATRSNLQEAVSAVDDAVKRLLALAAGSP